MLYDISLRKIPQPRIEPRTVQVAINNPNLFKMPWGEICGWEMLDLICIPDARMPARPNSEMNVIWAHFPSTSHSFHRGAICVMYVAPHSCENSTKWWPRWWMQRCTVAWLIHHKSRLWHCPPTGKWMSIHLAAFPIHRDRAVFMIHPWSVSDKRGRYSSKLESAVLTWWWEESSFVSRGDWDWIVSHIPVV